MSWDNPDWKKAAHEYHAGRATRASIIEIRPRELSRLRQLLADNVALEQAWAQTNKQFGAAASTIEALMLGLRERGNAALQEPKVRARLAQLSEAQLIEVGDRLQLLKPKIARAWTPDEVGVLVSEWRRLHVV